VTCEACNGRRYNRETLEIAYKGLNIADVLDMTVDEAVTFFRAVPQIYDPLLTLAEVGLGYIRLGQSGTTLSGGEAQRVKLASELSRKATGRTLYILDEPTTGLHFHDVAKLLEVLFKLRASGNTLLVIEHNLDVIRRRIGSIDMGPEGGDAGGEIVAEGTPEAGGEVWRGVYTGKYLGGGLGTGRQGRRSKPLRQLEHETVGGPRAVLGSQRARLRGERGRSFGRPCALVAAASRGRLAVRSSNAFPRFVIRHSSFVLVFSIQFHRRSVPLRCLS